MTKQEYNRLNRIVRGLAEYKEVTLTPYAKMRVDELLAFLDEMQRTYWDGKAWTTTTENFPNRLPGIWVMRWDDYVPTMFKADELENAIEFLRASRPLPEAEATK